MPDLCGPWWLRFYDLTVLLLPGRVSWVWHGTFLPQLHQFFVCVRRGCLRGRVCVTKNLFREWEFYVPRPYPSSRACAGARFETIVPNNTSCRRRVSVLCVSRRPE